MNVEQLYQRIYEAAPEKIRIKLLGDRKDYESLRTALVKKNSEMNMIDGNESLCAEFSEETSTATFWRAKRRRAERASFEILE